MGNKLGGSGGFLSLDTITDEWQPYSGSQSYTCQQGRTVGWGQLCDQEAPPSPQIGDEEAGFCCDPTTVPLTSEPQFPILWQGDQDRVAGVPMDLSPKSLRASPIVAPANL